MPLERVNAILHAFNEGRTLEEAAQLANEFLGMLGCIELPLSTPIHHKAEKEHIIIMKEKQFHPKRCQQHPKR